MREHLEEDAADARHETPPAARAADSEPQQNPFKTVEQNAEEYLRGAVNRGLLHTRLEGAVRSVLREIDRRRAEDAEHAKWRPTQNPGYLPGLTYQDPAGKFECNPSTLPFSGESLPTLELRVMAAHLSTALDNVNAELKKRQG